MIFIRRRLFESRRSVEIDAFAPVLISFYMFAFARLSVCLFACSKTQFFFSFLFAWINRCNSLCFSSFCMLLAFFFVLQKRNIFHFFGWFSVLHRMNWIMDTEYSFRLRGKNDMKKKMKRKLQTLERKYFILFVLCRFISSCLFELSLREWQKKK